MTLLYLAAAYLIGIAFGRLAWDAGLLTCDIPDWPWVLFLTVLPFTACLNRFEHDTAPAPPLRWPASAGFEPPQSPMSPALAMALLLCIVIGILRYASQPLTPCWNTTDLAYYNLPAEQAFDRQAPVSTVEGFVSDYPSSKDRSWRLRVAIDRMTVNNFSRQVHGTLLLTSGIRENFHYGDRLWIQGRLATPADFSDFSYREFLAGRGIHSVMYYPKVEVLNRQDSGSLLLRQLYVLRARGQALLNRLLPEPHAALANGILLGIDSGISDELYDKFNLTGTSHVLVISGSNVAVLAGALMVVFLRIFGKRWAVYLTLGGIGCYVLLVGADAAVVRAAMMGGLVIVAVTLNRSSSALISLAAACWLMTLINPLTLWDVGFQLSSLATAGLILFSVPLRKLFNQLGPAFGQRPLPSSLSQASAPPVTAKVFPSVAWLIVGLLVDGVAVTLAANIMVLPVVAYHFDRVSLLGILANLLIVPVQPLILLWGSVGLFAGLLGLPDVAQVLLWIPWLGLSWTVAVVEWVSGLAGASFATPSFGVSALALSYLCIFATRWPTRITDAIGQLPSRIRQGRMVLIAQPVTMGAMAVTAGLVWTGVFTLPDGHLHIYFLDVGQGDGVLIQTPSGRQVLVDGGASTQTLAQQVGAVMPFWDRSLDLMLLTHADADHMGGQIDLPSRLTIEQAVTTEQVLGSEDGKFWRDAMEGAGLPVSEQGAGGWLDLGDGVALWVLWPPAGVMNLEDNDSSLVSKLVYGGFSLLLTGDATTAVEQAMIDGEDPLTATVLKVAHHGSRSGTSPAFVRTVQPSLAVIQVGDDNGYGHPHEEVLAALSGRQVLRTDEDSRIHLWTDGKQLWIETAQ